jgi:hypothetical protein
VQQWFWETAWRFNNAPMKFIMMNLALRYFLGNHAQYREFFGNTWISV